MRNNYNNLTLLFITFAPFIFASCINNFLNNDFFTWIVFIFIIIYSLKKLIFTFPNNVKSIFIFFALLSLLLTILASTVALKLEGYESFKSIQNFTKASHHNSDLEAMADAINKFIEIFKDDGLFSATIYPYALMAFYNNVLSPLKFGYAVTAMPNIGFYALSIQAWWFIIIFYTICIYASKTQLVNIKNIPLTNSIFILLLPFLILPFSVPYDRESIVVVPISILALFILNNDRFSFRNSISIFICLVLIAFHRTGYLPIIPLVLMLLIFNKFNKIQLIFDKFNAKLVLRTFIILILIISYSNSFFIKIGSFFPVFDTVTSLLSQFQDLSQDNWQQFNTGFIFFDNIIKTIFLILTPFPFFQLFKSGENGELIINSVYISINIFPIYMIGKLLIILIFIVRLITTKFSQISLFLLSLLFLFPVLITPRTGPAYLIPSLILIVIWLISNGTNRKTFVFSSKIYIFLIFFLHVIYLIVYRKF